MNMTNLISLSHVPTQYAELHEQSMKDQLKHFDLSWLEEGDSYAIIEDSPQKSIVVVHLPRGSKDDDGTLSFQPGVSVFMIQPDSSQPLIGCKVYHYHYACYIVSPCVESVIARIIKPLNRYRLDEDGYMLGCGFNRIEN